MGLRDFLQGAQGLNEGVQSFAKDAADLRQEIKKKDFQTQSADLLSKFRTAAPEDRAAIASQYNQLAIDAGQAKNDPYAEAMAKSLFPAAGQNPQVTESQVKSAYGLKDEARAKEIAGMHPKLQPAAIAAAKADEKLASQQGARSENQNARIANQNEQKAQTSIESFSKDVGTAGKTYDEAIGGLKASYAAFLVAPTPQSAADLTTKIAKASGQVGAMAEGMQDQFHFNDVNAEITKALAKYGNEPEKQLPIEVVQAIKHLADATVQSTETKKADVMHAFVSSQIAGHGERAFDKNGNLRPGIADAAKRYGLDVKKTDKGLEVSKKTIQHTGDNADLVAMANTIPNSAMKAQFLGAIQKRGNEKPSQAEIDAFRSNVQKHGGKL